MVNQILSVLFKILVTEKNIFEEHFLFQENSVSVLICYEM